MVVLYRCRGVGGIAQCVWHVTVFRQRHHGLQTIRRRRQLRSAHEQLLQPLPVRPAVFIGEDACAFTTLYWDFLMGHASVLKKNPRTAATAKPGQNKARPAIGHPTTGRAHLKKTMTS
jgi:hypothetical protein